MSVDLEAAGRIANEAMSPAMAETILALVAECRRLQGNEDTYKELLRQGHDREDTALCERDDARRQLAVAREALIAVKDGKYQYYEHWDGDQCTPTYYEYIDSVLAKIGGE